jgi:hypothetical protein
MSHPKKVTAAVTKNSIKPPRLRVSGIAVTQVVGPLNPAPT